MKSHDVRKSFINYFQKQGHTSVQSSSLIPEDDPTLLFANAGMNQFKNLFLGLEKRPYTRAVSSQKCVRAGGKHNDLENVGFTARHHTFFEMLGNFSFGDYFKKEAIHFAWDYLTNDLGLSKDRLFVTVFESDDDAADIWHKQEGVAKDRIFRFGEKDNFWRMGDTGPCGPCSEIFYDRGEEHGKIKDPFKSIASGEDRIIEIWNLVFMQFFEKAPGKMDALPRPSVDTGAGLERVVSVVQGKLNNFDTDVFAPMIQEAVKISGVEYINDSKILSANKEIFDQTAAFRVLADHCRSTGFLIADGAIPGNEGRSYVLRRIMRRAIRYGRKLSDKSLLVPMIDRLITHAGEVYPELSSRRALILETVRDEESRFLQTLDTGAEILDHEIKKLIQTKKSNLPGDVVFKLYDTYGFPADLTRLMAEEKGISVNEAEFEQQLQIAKIKSKASWKNKGIDSDHAHLIQWSSDLKQSNRATDFVGYEQFSANSQIIGLSNGRLPVNELKTGESGFIALTKSAFYAEGGGQVGDVGLLKTKSAEAKVYNTIKQNEIYLHQVEVVSGVFKVQELLDGDVSKENRLKVMSNHSATHLMHAALRKVLGDKVGQAGSLVDAEKLRFDFTFNRPLTIEEIEHVEQLVNDQIHLSIPVQASLMPYKKALETGAIAMFGEKYGDHVRVLKMGDFSCELCGGTHVSKTSDIGLFKIVSESGVSSGVRRIEALTQKTAFEYLSKAHKELKTSKELAGQQERWDSYMVSSKLELPEWIQNQLSSLKELDRQIKKLKADKVDIESAIKQAHKTIKNIPVIVQKVSIDDRDALAAISDKIRNKWPSGLIIMMGEDESGAPIIVSVNKELTSQVKAGEIVKSLGQKFSGKGGGRPEFAQGSLGPNVKTEDVLKYISESF